MTQTTKRLEAAAIVRALLSITKTDIEDAVSENGIVVNDEGAANEISQLFLDAGVGGGVITGPYLQPINGTPKKVWYISTF
jgi:hypothetical protein